VKRALPFGLVIGLAALLRDPSTTASDGKRVALLVVAIVCMAWVFVRREATHVAWLPALGFVALSTLSVLHGSPVGLRDAATWIAGVGLCAAVSTQGIGRARAIARVAAVVLGGGAALHAIVSFVRGSRGMWIEGAQGNPNWLGLVLVIALPLALDAVRASRGRVRFVAFVAVVLQSFALGLCHARVAWVAAAVALVCIAYRERMRLLASPKRATTVAACLAFAIVGALVATSHTHRAAPRTHVANVSNEPYEAPATLAIRGRMWIARDGSRAAIAAFPLGVGLGRFSEAYLDAQGERLARLPPREAAREFTHATTAHDEYVQAAVETGPLGFALFVAAIVALVRATARSKWSAGLAASIVLAIVSLGDSPLRLPAAVALIALLHAATPSRRFAIPIPHARWALVVACALALVPSMRTYLGARAATDAQDQEPYARAHALAHAARIDPSSPEIASELGATRFLLGDHEGAVRALARAHDLGADVRTDLVLAQAAFVAGDLALAQPALDRAVARNPGSFHVRLAQGEVLRALGRTDEAARALAIARAVLPGHPALAEALDVLAHDRTLAFGE